MTEDYFSYNATASRYSGMRVRENKTQLWVYIGKLAKLPEWLDWLLSVVEPLMVLGVAFLVGYVACLLVLKTSQPDEQKRLNALLNELSQNWKVCLILLVVLFYRTIRPFLEQAEEAWGVKKRRPVTPDTTQEAVNPPKTLPIESRETQTPSRPESQ